MSGWPSNARTAGKWHSWCADCGAKVHKKANSCPRCGVTADDREGRGSFTVKYQGNVGKAEYTSDGEKGIYQRGNDA